MDILRHRRNERLKAYALLRQRRPELFTNPPGAPIHIMLDSSDQDTAADRATESASANGFSDECGDIGVVYHDPYLTVIRDAVRFASGSSGTYIRTVPTQEAPGVAVLPVLSDGRVVLVSHFRHADRAWHWEIPRGFSDPGSDGGQNARRELLEELGSTADRLLRLGSIHPNTGLSAGLDEIYLAHLAAEYSVPVVPSTQAAEEGIWDIKAVEPDVFRAMILGGDITDSYTVASYALAVARHALPDRAGQPWTTSPAA